MNDMPRPRTNQKRLTLIFAVSVASAFAAGAAFAADAKLDEANATTAKAIALLKESPKSTQPLDTHKKKAIDLLTRAQGEILKAKGE
jgi:hypothetical protein